MGRTRKKGGVWGTRAVSAASDNVQKRDGKMEVDTQRKKDIVRGSWVEEEDRGQFQELEKQRPGVICKGHRQQRCTL